MAQLRKIITKEEQEKKRRTRNFLIGMVLVLIMVFSSAAYALSAAFSNQGSTKTDNIKYKGIDFSKDNNGYWNFKYNSNTFQTRYNPLELNNTKAITGFSLASYNGQVLSFEWNESQEGVIEVDRNLEGNKIPKRVVPKACLTNNCFGDYPIKDCSVDKVISFRYPINNESEKVYIQDNCVFIVANETNQLKYADAFLYNIIGI
jgi:hypothetical protein